MFERGTYLMRRSCGDTRPPLRGATFSSESDDIQRLLTGAAPLPFVETVLSLIATWLTSWCGTSGGILAPSLSIGAGIGDWVAWLADPTQRTALITIGMAAYLSAVTQTPLTAAVIVTEMVGGESILLALVPAAAIASALSRVISPPL
jgi:H+/Cl- antiporter ClcA